MAGGNGSLGNPFQVSSYAELKEVGSAPPDYYPTHRFLVDDLIVGSDDLLYKCVQNYPILVQIPATELDYIYPTTTPSEEAAKAFWAHEYVSTTRWLTGRYLIGTNGSVYLCIKDYPLLFRVPDSDYDYIRPITGQGSTLANEFDTGVRYYADNRVVGSDDNLYRCHTDMPFGTTSTEDHRPITGVDWMDWFELYDEDWGDYWQLVTELPDWEDYWLLEDSEYGSGTYDYWSGGKHYLQTAHIQCPTGVEQENFAPIGSSAPYFFGVYNGQGYEIRDLYIDLPTTSYVGLFSGLHGEGFIYRVKLIDPVIIGDSSVGSLAGYLDYGLSNSKRPKVLFCEATGVDVTSNGDEVGGLVGFARSYINFCKTSGQVSAGGHLAGGIVGHHEKGTWDEETNLKGCISSCLVDAGASVRVGGLAGACAGPLEGCSATGNVKCSEYGGGLVGDYEGKFIDKCFATGDVIQGATWGDYGHKGGLIGRFTGSLVEISKSFATGNIVMDAENLDSGWSYGGFFGSAAGTLEVDDCFALGDVDVSDGQGVGGFGGEVSGSNHIYTNCFSAGLVNGANYVGGMFGGLWNTITTTKCFYNSTTSGQTDTGNGEPRTTSEMQSPYDETTFDTWDFVGIWDEETAEYPRLLWALLPLVMTQGVSEISSDGAQLRGYVQLPS